MTAFGLMERGGSDEGGKRKQYHRRPRMRQREPSVLQWFLEDRGAFPAAEGFSWVHLTAADAAR